MLDVVRSERADGLVDALADLVGVPLADPCAPEVVAVPSRGVERWVAQRLSDRLGVCANVEFPTPSTLLRDAGAAALGIDPATDPWRPEALVWPLVELVDAHLDDPLLAPLVAHLRAAVAPPRPGEPPAPLRRFEAAATIAARYDRYGTDRPSLLAAWADGADPAGWQAHLWRLLRRRIGVPGPAERTPDAVAALVADPSLVELPERLGCFGLTRLPPAHLVLLEALGAGRHVRLYLLQPSPALWQAVEQAAAHAAGLRRVDDPTARLAHHPLLRSWGNDARELQLVVGRATSASEHRPVDPPPATLLGRLQADIRADRAPGDVAAAPVAADDVSVQVHACHGRARQVEVLRDAIAHLLDADPSLELRDVIVMCPDVETFAPLVHAAFTPAPGGDPAARSDPTGRPRMAVRLADRSLRQTNPLLAVAATLVDLADGRVSASEVLGVAAQAPVARRFRLDRDDLATFERWVRAAGVRWGLDAGWRDGWWLGGVTEGTWRAGLDRLLLGVAMAGGDDCRTWAETTPVDGIGSSEIDLAGRVAEMVGRLGAALAGLRGPLPAHRWLERIADGVAQLAEPGPDEAWQAEQLAAELAEVAATLPADGGPALGLHEVRRLLADRLRGRPTRAGFRTGDLTVCTLVPMRSVPHRVVALLGLDDGAFPRHPVPDGDDLLGADPEVGERDPRREDRQLLLDALLAATDAVVITYAGRDERTNRRRPPAVPVAELLDVLDTTATAPGGGAVRDHVVTHHPLQAHDWRNFTPSPTGVPAPAPAAVGAVSWGYDVVQLAGAVAARTPGPPAKFLDAPLPPPASGGVVALDDLVGFVEHPVRSFLRRRLELWLAADPDTPTDALPTELEPLDRWKVGQRLLDAALAGTPLDDAAAAEAGRGELPPVPLAAAVLRAVQADVAALLGALGADTGATGSLDVQVDLPDGRRLVGTVPNVRDGRIVGCTYSRLGPKHRLALWVRFLALCAGRPDIDPSAVAVGRGPSAGQPPRRVELAAFGGDGPARAAQATALLAELVDLYDRGGCAPLPLPCATAGEWAHAVSIGCDDATARRRAAEKWDDFRIGDQVIPNEMRDRNHVEVWGADLAFDDLVAMPAPPDEAAWPTTGRGDGRFAALAMRLWVPLLAHEARR